MYEIVKPEIFEQYLCMVNQNKIAKKRSYDNKVCILAKNRHGGFALTKDGQLCHVFSLKPGQGTLAVKTALLLGANRLSCYGDDLPKFYEKFGFKVSVKQGDKNYMNIKQIRGAICL